LLGVVDDNSHLGKVGCNLRRFQNSRGTIRSLARNHPPEANHHHQESPRRTHSHSRHSIIAEQQPVAMEHSEITSDTWEPSANSLEDYLGACCHHPIFQQPLEPPSVPIDYADPESPTDSADTTQRHPSSSHSDFRCTQAAPLLLPHNHSHRSHRQRRPKRSLADAEGSARKRRSASLAPTGLRSSSHWPTPVWAGRPAE
jgi:hypothetical protein